MTMTKREEVARDIRQKYKKDELVDMILDYVEDASWNQEECEDLLARIFGEGTFDYVVLAYKLLNEESNKVELFAGN